MSDPAIAAPQVTRALVAAGADVLSIAESRHSLEDVYLELIDRSRARTPMSLSWRRIRAISRKELREYRRQRLGRRGMAIFPLIFLIQPLFVVFLASGTSADRLGSWRLCCTCSPSRLRAGSVLAAYSVAGERSRGGWSRC